jgi:hypothetical protein
MIRFHDPNHEYMREYQRQRRAEMKGELYISRYQLRHRRHSAPPLQAVLPDTRDLTARICGDPIKGRSALDKEISE